MSEEQTVKKPVVQKETSLEKTEIEELKKRVEKLEQQLSKPKRTSPKIKDMKGRRVLDKFD